MPALELKDVISTLERTLGECEPPPTSDPFELVLFENVAYLASPRRRVEAFEHLKSAIGTDPKQILGATKKALERVTAHGILKETFAEKLTACARIALEEHGGDLGAVVRGPVEKAVKSLRRFPGIGRPGAEKILLFAGAHPFLAPESNGLRVLVRLGFVKEAANYAKTYEAARLWALALGTDIATLQKAHLLLARLGREFCKHKEPRCADCPLAKHCPSSNVMPRRPATRR